MFVKIKFKYQLLILLAGLACAAGAVFLLNYILAGPRLGAHYDFLLSLKKPQAVSNDILIINTGKIIDTNDKFLVLLTLTEMNGTNLIMTDGELTSSSPLSVNESEIRRRFFDEYVLLGANIRNLFEAIRSGSVSPVQAPGYVERLVELTEQGRDRLLITLTDRDEDLIRAIAVFGGYMEAAEPPVLDKDGKLRRVQPIDKQGIEHPVYSSLKNRYDNINIDINGEIITPHNADFRSIDISLFREYEEASRIMRDVLVYGDGLGVFSQTLPEQSPLFLGDYSLIFREDMLQSSDSETREAWLRSREDYYKSLEAFVNGPAESLIVKNYNDIIEEEGLEALKEMRDELIQAFVYIRAQYAILNDIRTRLEQEVYGSFCIMGNKENTQYSALLANTIITGSHIKPISNKYVLLWSFAAVFIALASVFWLKPFLQLFLGLCISLLSLITFSGLFLYFLIWIDPLIAFGASVTGTLVIFLCKQVLIYRRVRLFRNAYGSAVSQDNLKELIKQGKPYPNETIEAAACVIAIKDINLLGREDKEKPQDAGRLKKSFFAGVKNAVFNSGGVIAGFEGDTIIACFGSPLEKNPNDKALTPVEKACSFVRNCLSDDKNAWRFGIDAGNCSFYWSQETGFSVQGRASVRARILASRTPRLKVRALITDFVCNELDIKADKIDSLYENSESIFELR